MFFFRKKIFFCLFLTRVFAVESTFEECLIIKELFPVMYGKVFCSKVYNHFNNSKATLYRHGKAIEASEVKISSFNAYRMGTSVSKFKDYKITAQILNNWDVISVLELSSNTGASKKHNEVLLKYYNYLKKSRDLSENNLNKIKREYDLPGYLKLLRGLQRLDSSWSLLLSGEKEGSKRSTVNELIGFFYRSLVVKPILSKYCNDIYGIASYACTIKFGEKIYGKDISNLIARRPFIANFKSGNFDFSLVAAHVIFKKPSDKNLQRKIVEEAFGENDYRKVGHGVNSKTFARFAEIKHILKWIKKAKNKYKENDIILQGDFNLESSNSYWEVLLNENKGSELKIEDFTTLSRVERLVDGTRTNGSSKNFDHFLFNLDEIKECSKEKRVGVFNFIENQIRELVDSKYLIRADKFNIGEYDISAAGKIKMEKFISSYLESMKKKLTIKRNTFVKRYNLEKELLEIKNRLFLSQIHNDTYYRYFSELISDHFPIYMHCSNLEDLD